MPPQDAILSNASSVVEKEITEDVGKFTAANADAESDIVGQQLAEVANTAFLAESKGSSYSSVDAAARAIALTLNNAVYSAVKKSTNGDAGSLAALNATNLVDVITKGLVAEANGTGGKAELSRSFFSSFKEAANLAKNIGNAFKSVGKALASISKIG